MPINSKNCYAIYYLLPGSDTWQISENIYTTHKKAEKWVRVDTVANYNVEPNVWKDKRGTLYKIVPFPLV